MTWVLTWATEGMELLFVNVGDASRRMKSWGKDQEFQVVLMLLDHTLRIPK